MVSGSNDAWYELKQYRISYSAMKFQYGNGHKGALLTLRWQSSYQDIEVVWQVCDTKWLWLVAILCFLSIFVHGAKYKYHSVQMERIHFLLLVPFSFCKINRVNTDIVCPLGPKYAD